MIPLVSILVTAVGQLGFKLVESAFKSKASDSAAGDFGKELQCRMDEAGATLQDGSARYAQAGTGLTASDVTAASPAALSAADAAAAYSKLARQWPGRLPGGGVIDWLQAP